MTFSYVNLLKGSSSNAFGYVFFAGGVIKVKPLPRQLDPPDLGNMAKHKAGPTISNLYSFVAISFHRFPIFWNDKSA